MSEATALKITEVVEESAALALKDFHRKHITGKPFDSSLEMLFFAAIWSRGAWQCKLDVFNPGTLDGLVEIAKRIDHPVLAPQVRVDGLRLDFAIVDARPCEWGNAPHIFAIECDGHNFHERTKEQARRDRSRDRRLASYAITVLRFTGSEIWASAGQCADETLDILSGQFDAARLRATCLEAAE